jgi:hypothetical protein
MVPPTLSPSLPSSRRLAVNYDKEAEAPTPRGSHIFAPSDISILCQSSGPAIAPLYLSNFPPGRSPLCGSGEYIVLEGFGVSDPFFWRKTTFTMKDNILCVQILDLLDFS